MAWNDDQQWEANWWGDCVNTFGEETKQISYAYRMGLVSEARDGKWPVYDLQGKSVIDIGGGPVSMLLKTFNGGRLVVADPCPYPKWTCQRYTEARIELWPIEGEDLPLVHKFDEAWIYNVLQHVHDPQKIIENARQIASIVRLFEWVDFPAHPGHPHELKAEILEQWLGTQGRTETMNGENGCYGNAFFAVLSTHQ